MSAENRSPSTRRRVAVLGLVTALTGGALPFVAAAVGPQSTIEPAEATVIGEIMSESLICAGSGSFDGHWEDGEDIANPGAPDYFGPTYLADVWVPAGATVSLHASGTADGNGGFMMGYQLDGNNGDGVNPNDTFRTLNTLTSSGVNASVPSALSGRIVELYGFVAFESGATVVDWTIDVTVNGGADDGPTCAELERRRKKSFGNQGSSGSVADPVNTATGNLFEQVTDLPAQGARSLALPRTYNSQDDGGPNSPGLDVPSVFGPGWTTLVDARLLDDDGNLEYRGPDGVRHLLEGDATSGWVSTDGFPAMASALGGGGYELDWPGPSTWTFDSGGLLSRLDDGTGHSLRITRSAGQPTAIAAWTGETQTDYIVNLVDDVLVDGTAGSDGLVDAVTGPGGEPRVDYTYFATTSRTAPPTATYGR